MKRSSDKFKDSNYDQLKSHEPLIPLWLQTTISTLELKFADDQNAPSAPRLSTTHFWLDNNTAQPAF